MKMVKVVVPGVEEFSFKPPILCIKAVDFMGKLYGAGHLCDSNGDVVLEDELLAGSYTYSVAVTHGGGTGGFGGFGEEPPDSQLEVQKLVDSCKEYLVTGEDTVESLREFLHDLEPLRGLVPVVTFPDHRKWAFVQSRSDFAIAISYFIGQTPGDARGGVFVNGNVCRWHAILEQIDLDSPLEKQLGIVLAMHRTESQPFFKKRKRPDYTIKVGGRTCLYGMVKADENMLSLAKSELGSVKRVKLPPLLYGSVKFLICFAAADTKFQLYMHNCITQTVEPLTGIYKLIDDEHRVELVLVIIKLYFLLLGMKNALAGA